MRNLSNHLPEERKPNNAGSAMIMALTIVSLIAVLGVMALSTALLNVKMRNLNRRSDKNFYYLETALDEIYAQTGRMASNILKENYVEIMGNLYKEDYRTNDEANLQLKSKFITQMLAGDALGITLPQTDENSGDNRKNAAEKLASFSDTIQKQNLDVSIGAIVLEEQVSGDSELTGIRLKNGRVGADSDNKKIYSGILLKDFRIVYTEPDTGIESAITVDFNITVPYLRFMNEGEALLNYVLAANGAIEININGGEKLSNRFEGNIYGESFTAQNCDIEAASGLFTSAGTLTLDREAKLTIAPDINTGTQSRVWADGILLNFASTLETENANIFVKDDLTLTGNKNMVTLKGSYYGYGNEGDDRKVTQETPSKSSAVIINDRGSTLNMRELDSLILAGRAYMRFDQSITGQDVYPMGESLAVKSTQTIYLVPESSITLEWSGNKEMAGSNPVLLPEGVTTLMLHVTLPDDMGGKAADYQITVKNPNADDDRGKGISIAEFVKESSSDEHVKETSPAIPVILNGKIYVYYNFSSENDRRQYFNNYLKNNADSFNRLLQKGGMTGHSSPESEFNGGIFIEDGSGHSAQINTSGSLYQVAGKDEGGDGHLFQLLEKGENGVSSSIKWANLIGNLNASFENLKLNLAETDRVGGRDFEDSTGLSKVLPIGNYVKLGEVEKLAGGEPVFLNEDGCTVLLSGDDVEIELNGDGEATVSTSKRSYSMKTGLVVSSKEIKVSGSGSFRGLLMSAGKISITGKEKLKLTADGQSYEPILNRKEIAKYFYDYSDVASTVLNDYEDFVTTENWSRSGREQGDQK